jgi:hypothetical protein
MRVRSRFEDGSQGQTIERIILDCPGLSLLPAERIGNGRNSAVEFRHCEE